MVEEEVVGETDQTGEVTFSVPEDVDELEVTIESGDTDAELEIEVAAAHPA
jgi:hypothetical protein